MAGPGIAAPRPLVDGLAGIQECWDKGLPQLTMFQRQGARASLDVPESAGDWDRFWADRAEWLRGLDGGLVHAMALGGPGDSVPGGLKTWSGGTAIDDRLM